MIFFYKMFELEFLFNRYINISLLCEELSKRKSKKILFDNWISDGKITSYLKSMGYCRGMVTCIDEKYYVYKHIVQIFFMLEFKEYFEEISLLINESELKYLNEIIKAKDKNIRSLKTTIDNLEEFRSKYTDEKHILEEKLREVTEELNNLKLGIEKNKDLIEIHF